MLTTDRTVLVACLLFLLLILFGCGAEDSKPPQTDEVQQASTEPEPEAKRPSLGAEESGEPAAELPGAPSNSEPAPERKPVPEPEPDPPNLRIVVNEHGGKGPVAGAAVTVTFDSTDGEESVTAVSDEQGVSDFALKPGVQGYRIEVAETETHLAYRYEYPRARISDRLSRQFARVDPKGRNLLQGKIRDALTGEPVSAFTIIVQGGNWQDSKSFSDSRGMYQLGKYELVEELLLIVRLSGYSDVVRRIPARLLTATETVEGLFGQGVSEFELLRSDPGS